MEETLQLMGSKKKIWTFEGGGDTTTHGEQEEDMDGEEFLGEQGDIGASFSDDMFEETKSPTLPYKKDVETAGRTRRLKVEETLQLMGNKKKIWMVRSFWENRGVLGRHSRTTCLKKPRVRPCLTRRM